MISKSLRAALLASAIAFLLVPNVDAAASKAKADKPTESTKKVATSGSDDAAIRTLLSDLSAAASGCDACKMSSMWMPEGSFVDEDGAETRGRQSIQDRFSSAWTASGKRSVLLTPANIKVLGSESAWVEGTVSRQTNLGMEPSTRFTMLLQKQNGGWLVASATETAIAVRSVADRLNVLDWMIGDWSAQNGNTKIKMNADWTSNKSFIRCQFTVEGETGKNPKVDNQMIGWDPSKEQIVSWHFDSDGSFGYGTWNKKGKQWVVSVDNVEQTGSHTSAMDILTVDDKNKFSWQSVNRVIDGVSVPDTSVLAVQRATK